MADILLRNPQSADALLLGVSSLWRAHPIGSRQHPYGKQSSLRIEGNVSFSPDAQAFDERIQILLVDWDWLRQSVSSTAVEELEVDYSYMESAGALAQKAPGMRLTVEQEQAYTGLTDFSYTLDDDY